MKAFFVRCLGCGRTKRYKVEDEDKHGSYSQQDTYQLCPDCRLDEDKMATHKLLRALFSQEPEEFEPDCWVTYGKDKESPC